MVLKAMPNMKTTYRFALATLAFSGADAFWRLPCRGRSGLGLVDPIVDYGMPSTHAHTIHGSSNFGLDTTNEHMMQGDCTSCGVKEDMSTYWTPPLYFQYANGTSVMLDQPGGMLSYYLLYGDDIVEFPQGFQMIAGDPWRRNFTCKSPEPPRSEWSGYEVTQDALQQKALGFNCLNYAKSPEPSLGRHGMPTKDFIDNNCLDGIRLEVFFPSCWNGKDATALDHKSHMAYPSIVQGGDCPAGYPKRTPSLFYETIFATAPFKGEDGEFVISMGDTTGYGYHGDFMSGWQEGFLQKAIETCTSPSGNVQDCPLFTLNSEADMGQCKMPTPPKSAEPGCTGPMEGLPGGAKVQNGPERAIPPKVAGGSSDQPLGPPGPPSASSSSDSAPKPSSYSDTQAPSSPPAISSQPQSAGAMRPGSTTGDLVIAQAVNTAAMSDEQTNVAPTSAQAAPAPTSTQEAPPAPTSTQQAPPAPTSTQEAPPAPTPAEEVVAASASALPTIYSTAGACADSTVIKSDGMEWDVCITDIWETVTADAAPSAAPYKRHLHEHKHHRRAGHGSH